MALLIESIPARDRRFVVLLAALLLVFALVQAADPEVSMGVRAVVALGLVATSIALVRNWRFAREAALVFCCMLVFAAAAQLVLALVGITVPPVPIRTYVSLAVAVGVLACTLPAVARLWRTPKSGV